MSFWSSSVNCVLVSVEAIVISPPLSLRDTLLPAVKDRTSVPPSMFPPVNLTVLKVLVSAVMSSTTKSIVPSPSSYVADTLVSVLLVNIAPTISCTCSVVSWVSEREIVPLLEGIVRSLITLLSLPTKDRVAPLDAAAPVVTLRLVVVAPIS